MKHNKGFTLLEMLLVIFLISLIVGISAVVFTRFLPSQQVDATAREIIATFRQARSDAVITGKPQVLTFEIDNHSFGIDGSSSSRTIPSGISVKVVDPVYGDITRGGYRFVFSPSGVNDGGTIILQAGKKIVVLEIDPIVGAVYARPSR